MENYICAIGKQMRKKWNFYLHLFYFERGNKKAMKSENINNQKLIK